MVLVFDSFRLKLIPDRIPPAPHAILPHIAPLFVVSSSTLAREPIYIIFLVLVISRILIFLAGSSLMNDYLSRFLRGKEQYPGHVSKMSKPTSLGADFVNQHRT